MKNGVNFPDLTLSQWWGKDLTELMEEVSDTVNAEIGENKIVSVEFKRDENEWCVSVLHFEEKDE